MYAFSGLIQSTSSVVLAGTLISATLDRKSYLNRGVAILFPDTTRPLLFKSPVKTITACWMAHRLQQYLALSNQTLNIQFPTTNRIPHHQIHNFRINEHPHRPNNLIVTGNYTSHPSPNYVFHVSISLVS
jgi:hypothetical protein